MVLGRRRLAARVVASGAAVFWGFFWFGLLDLLVVVEQDPLFDQNYLFESGWGLLYLVLVAVPLVVLAKRPGQPIAIAQLVVDTLAVLVGALWRGSFPQLWNGLGLALTVGLLAWLGRGRPIEWHRPDSVLSLLALIGLPAALVYGVPLIRNTTETEDITNGVSHWPMQASLALAVVGLVALAAVSRGRLPAWTAALSALWLGVESVVYPDLRASLGTTGGILTAIWALLVLVAVEVATGRGGPAAAWSDARIRQRQGHSRGVATDRDRR
jgi:hypothetical protein